MRPPGIGANMGNYRGNIRGQGKAFSQDGLSFSGNIRTRRPLKGGGGGSNSGGFNNGGQPIDVKAPGIGAFMGNFSVNLRYRSPLKGGGSISGSWNNGNRAIDLKPPGLGATFIGQYQGFTRRRDATTVFNQAGSEFFR